MADVSRSRISIATMQAYLKSLITTAQPTWDVQIYPNCDITRIFKIYPYLNVNTGACVITYSGSPQWSTFENPGATRKMRFDIVLAYNIYGTPSDHINYIQTMIESVISILDCQMYQGNATMMVAGDKFIDPPDKDSGITCAVVTIIVDDKSA